ncbi:uncharacterized protein [Ciconia boyciana]|uniref:uncharacterized protein n=1 Tax=Ciconia boyciana TaxID=52775 RepID=UPI003BA28923
MLNEFSSEKDGINFSALPTHEPFKSEISRKRGPRRRRRKPPTGAPRPDGRPCLPARPQDAAESAHPGPAALPPPGPALPPGTRPAAVSPQQPRSPRAADRCPPTVPAAPPGEGAPGRPGPAQPPRGADPRTGLAHGHGRAGGGRARTPAVPPGLESPPGRGTPARGSGITVRGSRRSPLQLYPLLPPRPPPPSDQGQLQPSPAELPPADPAPAAAQRLSSPRLASPHGAAGALRSPAQHKPGLSPSLREVSCHHSGRGKQKLQSREQEEEEGQRKQKSEGHCSPAAPLPSAADLPRRAARSAPPPHLLRRRLCCTGSAAEPPDRGAGRRASASLPRSLPPSLPACRQPLPAAARPARRSAAEPRPRRGSASRGRAHAPAQRLPPPPVAVGAPRRSGARTWPGGCSASPVPRTCGQRGGLGWA